MKSNNNMITGNPAKSLILFALPMMLGMLLQQLYNIVDSIIVGQALGQEALSAVGSTSVIVNVYIAIAIGLSTGCMVVFSQLRGAGNFTRMKTAFYTAIIFLALLSVAALAAGLASTEGVLKMMNTMPEIYEDSRTYYMIYVLSFPALFVYNIANSGYNSLGISKMTLFLLGGSSVLNILLDLWFVMGLGWGVAGAAIATDISQYIVAVIAIILLLRHLKKNYVTESKPAVFELKILGNMLKVAIPTMLAQVVVSVGYLALQSLVNSFNSIDITSGYVAGFKIDSLCAIPMIQMGNAMATYTGQNVGAKQFDRIPQGVKASSLVCVAVWIVYAVIIRIFGHGIIGLFMEAGANEAAYTAGVEYMQIMSSFYVMLGLMYVFSATLRGAGDALFSVIAVTCNFAARCAFAYIMVAITGMEQMIWWSNPIGWFIALIMCIIRYRSGVWKTKRLADKV